MTPELYRGSLNIEDMALDIICFLFRQIKALGIGGFCQISISLNPLGNGKETLFFDESIISNFLPAKSTSGSLI